MQILEPGDTLDHYRIDAQVARSGMATIFRATDLRDQSQVAIKVPHPEMEADAVLFDRFRREEDIGKIAEHPGVMKVLANDDRSRVYMVMEWVDGTLLRTILHQQKQLPIERATSITIRVCDALEYLHKRGIVHRDLKPENIMLDEHDNIKLIDFGIAMKEDARRLTFTHFSQTLGTPDYISPEQVQGKRGDARSDIYSLGVIFYEMLTGTVPFTGPNPFAIMNERVLNDPPSARKVRPEITPQLQEIIYRALERDPRHRYSTAHEFEWDLDHQEQIGVEERTIIRSPRPRRSPVRKRVLFYIGIALIPVVLFCLMLLLSRHQ